MANIRVDVNYTIQNGSEVSFTAPCDCTELTGLKVYHQGGSKVFVFKDAHGNSLNGVGNLFAAGAFVKVILDVSNGNAFIQNADTNAYLEGQLASKRPNTWTPTAQDVGAIPIAGAQSLLFGAVDEKGAHTNAWVTSYPTIPGVFRVNGVFEGLPPNIYGYGCLLIFNGGSDEVHIYRDGNGAIYEGRRIDGQPFPQFNRLVSASCFSYSNGVLSINI